MNILVLSWRDPEHPLAGGAEQVMHEHMKGWVARGHNVYLFSSHYRGSPRYKTLDGINIVRYGFQIFGVHIAAFVWWFFGKHPRFNLVVDEFHGIPFLTPFYIRIPKIAVLQEVAREVWFLNPFPQPFKFLVGIAGRLFEPVVFLFYKKVPFIVGSESAKSDIKKMGIPEKNISVINHGVLVPETSHLLQKDKTKTIIFLGALAKDKGIEDAINCFAGLNKKAKFNFWVVGKKGGDFLEILTLSKDLGLGRKIKFWGFVSEKQKFDLLGRAFVLINPSIREGWGLVNIEANAMGTPVVAYKSPGLVDSVKDGVSGILCRQNSPEEMVNEIIDLVSDPGKYKKLSKSSLVWSKNFSWEKARKESLNLIEKITK